MAVIWPQIPVYIKAVSWAAEAFLFRKEREMFWKKKEKKERLHSCFRGWNRLGWVIGDSWSRKQK